jgi:hypothetical protein
MLTSVSLLRWCCRAHPLWADNAAALQSFQDKGLVTTYQAPEAATALHRGAVQPSGQHALHVAKARQLQQLVGLVVHVQAAHPGQHGNVGNAVVAAHDPFAACQALVQHTQQAFGFVHIALQGAFIFKIFAAIAVKKPHLTKHGPGAAHLPHQPLQGFVALRGIQRQ